MELRQDYSMEYYWPLERSLLQPPNHLIILHSLLRQLIFLLVVSVVWKRQPSLIKYSMLMVLRLQVLRHIWQTSVYNGSPTVQSVEEQLLQLHPHLTVQILKVRLHASVASGTEAGVIELVAQIALNSGKIISSDPVKITVHSGFPDQAHFTIIPYGYVFPRVISNSIAAIIQSFSGSRRYF